MCADDEGCLPSRRGTHRNHDETAASAGQGSDDPAAGRRHSGEAAVSAKPLLLVRSTYRRPTVTG
jgi:hypothetical protein